MSTQKEIKETLINFQIKTIDLIHSSLQSPKAFIADEQIFSFNISVEQKLDPGNKCLIVITHVEITTPDDIDYKLATAAVACLFSIENYNDVIRMEKDQVVINPGVIEILNSISYSTTRGVLSQLLRGTYLHNAIMPIIDPKTFKKVQ